MLTVDLPVDRPCCCCPFVVVDPWWCRTHADGTDGSPVGFGAAVDGGEAAGSRPGLRWVSPEMMEKLLSELLDLEGDAAIAPSLLSISCWSVRREKQLQDSLLEKGEKASSSRSRAAAGFEADAAG
ncbi:hypothetical protein ACLOJK_002802 [Asimina triloba]